MLIKQNNFFKRVLGIFLSGENTFYLGVSFFLLYFYLKKIKADCVSFLLQETFFVIRFQIKNYFIHLYFY